MSLTTGDSIALIGIILMFTMLYVSYPFAVGENNGIDALYATLSVKRSTVVLGRYLFALVLDVCGGLFAYLFTAVIWTVLGKEFNARESLAVTLAIFGIYSVMQAIQLPIFFKLGYMKAKFLAYLPLAGMPLLVVIFSNLLKDVISFEQITDLVGWFAKNPAVAILLGVVLWCLVIGFSYRISVSHYAKRDL